MKEFRVKITIRNNLLLTAITDAGYKSQSEFAKACGLKPSDVNALVGFRAMPIKIDGTFTDDAKIIMETLGACPSDLWTTEQLSMRLKTTSAELSLSKAELLPAWGISPLDRVEFKRPDEYLEDKQKIDIVENELQKLTEKEQQVIKYRNGFLGEDLTLKRIGEEMGITQERARQIESKALRKLRLLSRDNDELKQFF